MDTTHDVTPDLTQEPLTQEHGEQHGRGTAAVSNSVPSSESSDASIEERFPELEHVTESTLSDQIRAFTTVLQRLQRELDDATH
ncbi:hypothetical protein [Bifidobacterium aquikefiricola]|uniref:Uncharacterized protein n=1 Tax=Bifidobacterium aquikefiricola TaxID=3059038 RepID=A0AB39U510_9BIFI